MLYTRQNMYMLMVISFWISSFQLISFAHAGEEILLERDAERQEARGQVKLASEQYSRIGELILSFDSLEAADTLFDKALKLNSENQTALFYSAIIKPLLEMRGFASRLDGIKGINDSTLPYEKNGFCKDLVKNKKSQWPLYYLACLVPYGKKQFKNYHEVQRFLRTTMQPLIIDSTNKLQRIERSDFINVNIENTYLSYFMSAQKITNYTSGKHYNCLRGGDSGTWICKIFDESSTLLGEKTKPLVRASIKGVDISILRGSLMAISDFIRLATAYDLTGIEYLFDELKTIARSKQGLGFKKGDLTSRDVIGPMMRYRGLFLLESDHQLSELSKTAGDVLKHLMDLQTLNSEICNTTTWKIPQDPFIDKFFCNADSALRNIEYLLDLLAGPQEIELGKNKQWESVKILLDITPIIKNPISDIKSILPTEFSEYGNATDCPDPTFGGLFPDGDILSKLRAVPHRRIKAVR